VVENIKQKIVREKPALVLLRHCIQSTEGWRGCNYMTSASQEVETENIMVEVQMWQKVSKTPPQQCEFKNH
jgi:hypothetical protein